MPVRADLYVRVSAVLRRLSPYYGLSWNKLILCFHNIDILDICMKKCDCVIK